MLYLIESLKKHKRYINAAELVPLPSDTRFWNLSLSYTWLVNRFDYINELIIEMYDHFEEIKKDSMNPQMHTDPIFHAKHSFYIEELVYWLKKSTDEIIGLIYILEKFKESWFIDWPKKIGIDWIWVLLDENKKDLLWKSGLLLSLKKYTFRNS